jgi:Domain of unknown function (DUF1772)
MDIWLKAIAVISSGMFAGAAFYISAVEHPARMSTGVTTALQEFRSSYKRAAPIQVTLAVVCFLTCLALWISSRSLTWLVGGVLTLSVVPHTLIFMMKGNRILLDAHSLPDGRVAESLLRRWGRLHAIRTVLGLSGFLVLVYQSIRK